MLKSDIFCNILTGIELDTLFSTFVGALLAFICAQYIQRGIEKRAEKAENKKEKEYRAWQLNYLNNFLYIHIVAFSEIFTNLQLRLDTLSNLEKNKSISETDYALIINKIVDYQMSFSLNEENLMFTCDDNRFIIGLGLTKTSLLSYYNAIDFLNNNLEQFSIKTMTLNIVAAKNMRRIIEFSLNGVALAIDTYNNMLKTVTAYNDQHDKLLLNTYPKFNEEQQFIINKSNELVAKSMKNREEFIKFAIKSGEK